MIPILILTITGIVVASLAAKVLLSTGYAHKAARRALLFWPALLAFFTGYLLCMGGSYIGQSANFVFGEWQVTHRGHIYEEGRIIGDAFDEDLRQELQQNKQAIIFELWLRDLAPPLWQPHCFTRHPTACDLADHFTPHEAARLRGSWLFVLSGPISALAAGLFMGFINFLREKRHLLRAGLR
jgi:hypothetical protein